MRFRPVAATKAFNAGVPWAARALKDADYDVVEAPDGLAALAVLRAGAPVDVVLSDVMMPHMSGVELGHVLQVEFPTVPIVLMSGYSGLDPVPFPFIRKPFHIPAVVAIISELLSENA